jgi:hypothetical protein
VLAVRQMVLLALRQQQTLALAVAVVPRQVQSHTLAVLAVQV